MFRERVLHLKQLGELIENEMREQMNYMLSHGDKYTNSSWKGKFSPPLLKSVRSPSTKCMSWGKINIIEKCIEPPSVHHSCFERLYHAWILNHHSTLGFPKASILYMLVEREEWGSSNVWFHQLWGLQIKVFQIDNLACGNTETCRRIFDKLSIYY